MTEHEAWAEFQATVATAIMFAHKWNNLADTTKSEKALEDLTTLFWSLHE